MKVFVSGDDWPELPEQVAEALTWYLAGAAEVQIERDPVTGGVRMLVVREKGADDND